MPGPVSSVQSSGLALAPEVVVASGPPAKGVEDRAKTVGWLGVAAEAVLASCVPATDDISSRLVIRIEETEASLPSFALISSSAKGSVFDI
jgi:hypothetical protein